MKQYLPVGKVVSTHGIRGELRVHPLCDGPEFICKLKTLYWDGNGLKPVSVNHSRPHKNIALVTLSGVETVAQADVLRGKTLYFNRDDVELAPGQYYVDDLIGLQAINADTGRQYGTLRDVSFTGANDVYHIADETGREYLFPAVPEMIEQINLETGQILIRPIKGIFNDEN